MSQLTGQWTAKVCSRSFESYLCYSFACSQYCLTLRSAEIVTSDESKS